MRHTTRREMAALKGHSEARHRLISCEGWDSAAVGTLEDAVDSYEEFARCVADTLNREYESDD